jgi:hypothetical protein
MALGRALDETRAGYLFATWKPMFRQEAANSLAMIGGMEAAKILVEYLKNPSGTDWGPMPNVFVTLWQEKQIPGVRETLISSLQRAYGNIVSSYVPLAEIFLNSGDMELVRIAVDWAKSNGYIIVKIMSGKVEIKGPADNKISKPFPK